MSAVSAASEVSPASKASGKAPSGGTNWSVPWSTARSMRPRSFTTSGLSWSLGGSWSSVCTSDWLSPLGHESALASTRTPASRVGRATKQQHQKQPELSGKIHDCLPGQDKPAPLYATRTGKARFQRTKGCGSRNGETLLGPRIEGRKVEETPGTNDESDGRQPGPATEGTAGTPPIRTGTTGTTATPRTAVAAWRDGRDKATVAVASVPFPRRPWRPCCRFGRCPSGRRRCRRCRRLSLGRFCPLSLPSPVPAVPFRLAGVPEGPHRTIS